MCSYNCLAYEWISDREFQRRIKLNGWAMESCRQMSSSSKIGLATFFGVIYFQPPSLSVVPSFIVNVPGFISQCLPYLQLFLGVPALWSALVLQPIPLNCLWSLIRPFARHANAKSIAYYLCHTHLMFNCHKVYPIVCILFLLNLPDNLLQKSVTVALNAYSIICLNGHIYEL